MASLEERVNIGVGIFVFNEDGDVLLCERLADKHGKGEWGLPGGKPDPGEDPGYTAVRELYEETGLVAYDLEKLDTWTYDVYRDHGVHFVTVYYSCNAKRQTPRNTEPDKQGPWEWFDPENLPTPLFCGIAEAVKALGY
jgi:8-oxo-dGTP diphosphatase